MILSGVSHFLMSMLTLNFKIVPEILVSDLGGGQSSFDDHDNSVTLKLYVRLWSVFLAEQLSFDVHANS